MTANVLRLLNEAAIHFESFPGGRDGDGMALLYSAIKELKSSNPSDVVIQPCAGKGRATGDVASEGAGRLPSNTDFPLTFRLMRAAPGVEFTELEEEALRLAWTYSEARALAQSKEAALIAVRHDRDNLLQIARDYEERAKRADSAPKRHMQEVADLRDEWRKFRLALQEVFTPGFVCGDSGRYSVNGPAFYEAIGRLGNAIRRVPAPPCEHEFAPMAWSESGERVKGRRCMKCFTPEALPVDSAPEGHR